MWFRIDLVPDTDQRVVSVTIQDTIRALGERHDLKPTRMNTAGRSWLLVGTREQFNAFMHDVKEIRSIYLSSTDSTYGSLGKRIN